MKKMINSVLWMVLTAAVFVLCPAAVMAAEEPLCAALVIDISGSMTRSDPEGAAREAACLFLDMMDRSGSQAAVILFSDRIVKKTKLRDLGSGTEAGKLKKTLRKAGPEGDTDIGSAVLSAVKLLEKADPLKRKTVICFTDGKTDLPFADDPLKAEKESREKLDKAASRAGKGGIPINFVRLYNEEEDEAKDLPGLEEISARTGGSVYAASGREMIPEIFTGLFAGLLDTGAEPVADLKIGKKGKASFDVTVPPDGAVMADVVLLTTKPVTKITVTDPGGEKIMDKDGNAAESTESDDDPPPDAVRITREDTYTLIRLDSPSPGTWHFVTNADKGCRLHVSMVLENEIVPSVIVEEDENGDALVRASLTRGGNALDETAAKRFTLTASVKDVNGKTIRSEGEYPMTFKDGSFSAVIPVDPAGEISVRVKAVLGDLQKFTDDAAFTSSRSDDIIVNGLPKEMLLTSFLPSGASETVKLTPFLSAWDGSPLTYALDDGAPPGTAAKLVDEEEETYLVLTNAGCGDGTVTVTAKDAYGHEEKIVFPVQSKVILFSLATPALVIILVVSVLLWIRIRKDKQPLEGRIGLMFSSGSGEERTLGAFFDGRARTSSLTRLFPLLEQTLPDLKKIRVIPFKDGVVMKNHGAASLYDCYGDPAGTLKLKDGDTFEIVCTSGHGQGKPLQISGVYDK